MVCPNFKTWEDVSLLADLLIGFQENIGGLHERQGCKEGRDSEMWNSYEQLTAIAIWKRSTKTLFNLFNLFLGEYFNWLHMLCNFWGEDLLWEFVACSVWIGWISGKRPRWSCLQVTRRTAEVVVNIRYFPPEMCSTLMGVASVLPPPNPPRKTKKSCLKGLSGHFLAINDPRLWWESPLEPTEGGQAGCHGAWGLFNRFHWIYSEAECGGNAGTRWQKDWPETTLCVSWEDSWVDDGSDFGWSHAREASKMSMQTLCQGWPCKEPSQKLWSKATWKLMTSRTVSWYCTSSPKLTHQLIISTYGTNSYFIYGSNPEVDQHSHPNSAALGKMRGTRWKD